jgi:hypothetical protein
MITKQLSSKNEQIKTQIIKDRLTHLFKENQKEVVKILLYILKRDKKNV